MVREQTVAFAISDFENLIDELKEEKIISSQEHEQMSIMKNMILERTGFIVE